MKRICLVLVVNCMFLICEASHFRGGTISWKPTGNLYEAEFSYRLGWRYGNGHGCNETLVNQYVNRSSSTWRCTSGCSPSTTISSNGYTCIAASKTEEWELGEFSFNYKFDSAGPFTITYTGGAWISLSYGSGGGSWSIQTIVDFGSRSDTRQPNYSPTLAGKPTYTVMYGCVGTINIPVLDQEGDKVRCRWANGSSECGSICNAIPNASLNEETCSLTVHANHAAGGIYAVAIMVEDYPKTTISIGGQTHTPNEVISKSPFQFLVETPSISSRSCSDKPVFVIPSPPETKLIVIQQGHLTGLKLYATSAGSTIDSFLTIGPPGVTQSSVRREHTRPEVFYVDVMWTPTINDIGRKTICFEATDAFGIATDLYCLTIAVIDIDPCDSSPCLNNGTCTLDGYTANYVCTCAPGFTDRNCQTDIDECASSPCLNGATCFNLIDEYFCGCMEGFTGVNCETDIDECESMCCLNGGTCIDTVGAAICVCLPDVTGEICQTDYCQSKPCQNGGKCVYNETTGYVCDCVDGWQGVHCSNRHENESFTSSTNPLTTDYMHYSDCNCYFGYGKQQLCYNNNINPWYGVSGALLGIVTVVMIYAIIDGCFHEQLCCLKDEILDAEKQTEQTNEAKPAIEEQVKVIPVVEQPETSTKPGNIPGHRHRKCWACDVKYNKQAPPPP